MTRGVRKYLVGCLVIVALAGCGRSVLQYAEREPWRREAESRCLQSGAVREGADRVRIKPIAGPGVCGADYPLKVASLGDVRHALGYAGEPVRPPAAIPGGARVVPPPQWPVAQPRAVQQQPMPQQPTPQQPLPPAATGAPIQLTPPGAVQHGRAPEVRAPHTVAPAPQPDYGPPQARPPATPTYTVVPTRRTDAAPVDRTDHGFQVMPRQPAHSQPPHARPLPALGPRRPPPPPPVEVKPTATLACPVVSALDRWVAAAVQPAAYKWFGQPVAEIRQISAYSCRGMNAQRNARISEHAFGNALDIAAFVLADGTRITVERGWRGAPEQQGFLRDVQGAACDHFTTVLAPGSNRFHHDHFHVDLMRRANGRRICNPGAVDGEVVAARARGGAAAVAAARQRDPGVTGSIGPRARAQASTADEDDDWVEDEGPRPAIRW